MSGDTIEIFFTVEPIVDAVLIENDLSPPVVKISRIAKLQFFAG